MNDRRKEIYANKRLLKIKQKIYVLKQYGGKCAFCKTDELAELSLDHINDDGCKYGKYEREKIYWDLRKELVDGEKRTDIQVLCMSCQFRKRAYGKNFETWGSQIKRLSQIGTPEYHPGKPSKKDDLPHDQKCCYGGKCVKCGIDELAVLSIDHINDDGNNDKSLYKSLRKCLKNGEKVAGLQILCMGCQFKKRAYGGNFSTWEEKAKFISKLPLPIFRKRGRVIGTKRRPDGKFVSLIDLDRFDLLNLGA